jgi:hypothetical protein
MTDVARFVGSDPWRCGKQIAATGWLPPDGITKRSGIHRNQKKLLHTKVFGGGRPLNSRARFIWAARRIATLLSRG